RVLHRIENLDRPSIATLFGNCLGGGLELPLACTFRLASDEGAKIGLPEMDLGSVPAWGGTARLTRAVGRANALDVILRVRKLTGSEALDMGLVQQVHQLGELKARAHEFALELAQNPPIAMAEVLRCVVVHGDSPLEEAFDAEWAAFHR
ncbi:MAG: enoyl-CoA hydratase/isomerase family protein, partial [Microthrixaceae bacterium]